MTAPLHRRNCLKPVGPVTRLVLSCAKGLLSVHRLVTALPTQVLADAETVREIVCHIAVAILHSLVVLQNTSQCSSQQIYSIHLSLEGKLVAAWHSFSHP